MAFELNNAPLLVAPAPQAVRLNTPDENAEAQQRLLDAQQKSRDLAEQRQTSVAFQQALQQSGGDYDAALNALDKQGLNTLGMRKSLQDYKDKIATAAKTHIDTQKTENEVMSSLWAGVHDQASQDRIMPLVQRIDPEFASRVNPVYDDAAAETYRKIGLTAGEQLKMSEDAINHYAKGDYQHGLSLAIAATTNDDDLQGAVKYARMQGVPDAIVNQLVPSGSKWSPELVAQAKSVAIGPEKMADLSEKQAAGARADVREERMATAQQQQMGMERQRLGLEGARVGMERQRLGMEQQKNAAEQAQANAAAIAADPNAPHGDKFLSTLPPSDQAIIKALDEGRTQFPSAFALKSPYWQQKLGQLAQYDPNFDTVNYNARAKTRNDFTSGKSAQQINAINTAIGHLDQLSDLADALHNKDFNTYNRIANSLMTEFGWTGKTDYDTVLGRVAPEITRVWRGTGGNESDIQRDIDTLNSSRAAGQIHGSVANLGDMLKSKIDSFSEQYAQGMGTKPIEMTTPQARATLNKLSQRAGRADTTTTTPQRRPIPGVPGGIAELRDGRWIRVQ